MLTKAGMTRLGEMFAAMFAGDGIRVNTIILELVRTSMALGFNAEKTGKSVEEVSAARDAKIPLKGGQGTALGYRGRRVSRVRRGALYHRRQAAGGRRQHDRKALKNGFRRRENNIKGTAGAVPFCVSKRIAVFQSGNG